MTAPRKLRPPWPERGVTLYPLRQYAEHPSLWLRIKYAVGTLVAYPGAGTVRAIGCENCGHARRPGHPPRLSHCDRCLEDCPYDAEEW